MTSLKFAIVLLFFVFAIQNIHSQTYKFKTSGLSVLDKKPNGKWGEWSDLNLVNLLVTLDTNKNRIVVYSEMIQLFEVVNYLPETESDTDIVYSFTCKNNNGIDCIISIITRKNQDNRKQLYINYGDRIILYNLFNM
ncbi:hypothetical protein [Flavobacterium sp.]|uniref:hypothetical protein n=1 Tax=Flavobacterium sp. TaxID=239 RepID=UPI003C4A63E9